MVPTGYQDNGDGTWWVTYDNGVAQLVDAEGNILSSSYQGATAYETLPQSLEPGHALITDENGTPLRDGEGNYLTAPMPEGADSAYYQTAGHPAYDQGTYPSFIPSGPGTAAPATSTTTTQGASSGDYTSGGYSSGGGRGGGYSPGGGYGGYSSGGGYSAGGSAGGGRDYPTYADGSLHPAWGGPPRTPGGFFNDGQSSGQQQIYGPDGQAAGPFETRAARSPSASYNGGGSSSGGGGGGGSALYQAWRDKLTAKLYPGSGSGYSGSSGGASGYPGEIPPDKMRGPYAKKLDPEQAATLNYRPSMMIPRVAPALPSTSPRYQEMADMPSMELASIMSNRRVKMGKPATSRYSTQKGGYVTRGGRPGNFTSVQTNALGRFYDNAINQGELPEADELLANLRTAGRRTIVGSQLRDQPAGYAASTYSNLLGAVLSQTMDPGVAAARSEEADGLIDRYGAKFLKREPKKAPPINKWVGRRLSYG